MENSNASHSPTPVCVRNENASLGRSGAGAARSSRSIATSAAIATAIRPILENGCSTIDADDVPAIATQIRATRPAGTRGAGIRRADAGDGRLKKAAIANTPAATAVASNAPRQLPKRANIPPTSRPTKTDMLQLADINAMVHDQIASRNVPRTTP